MTFKIVNNFLYLIFAIYLLSNCFINSQTTSDLDFINKFNSTILKPGNGIKFPVKGNRVFFHFKSYDPKRNDTNKYHEDSRQMSDRKPWNYKIDKQIGLSGFVECWNEVFKHMSIGEIVKVICPANITYKDNHHTSIMNGELWPSGKDIAFEIELIDFHGRGRKKRKEEL